jgi:hypothetical protein
MRSMAVRARAATSAETCTSWRISRSES